ncbi:response regulator [Falsiroseomonas selenitidurans]|uniref:Response regulator n=1 Tax=Falsiroseomonas selenitidurans TaxID=2716335 RepID=A0ABX1DX42_9PROT|nr:response regulator [Falsiroseomonas selenitidurans]NKC29494.1 response regulator [Falsiroseomonas selenitidurans]OYW09799.1 MAG: hypothetical protein B7Z53_02245 [Rhodospirillales bacterium 12-71-4]
MDTPRPVPVIIVDDEPDLALEIAEGLEAEGFATTIAESAQDAIRRLLAAPQGGVVVTDLRMPGMGGLQLIRLLRQPPFTEALVQIVAMSGHAGPADQQAARDAGAGAVLLKPFAWEDLVAATTRARDALLAGRG